MRNFAGLMFTVMASTETRKKQFLECLRSLKMTTKIITKHKLDKARKFLKGEIKNDPKLKFWVKKRKFAIVDLPKLGLKNVVVVPALGAFGPETTIFGSYRKVVPLEELYAILENLHENSLQHHGYKRTLYEAQRHYYGITRFAVDAFIKGCPCYKGQADLDGLYGPRRQIECEGGGNLKRYKTGDVVTLKVPQEYKQGLDIDTLPCIIVSMRNKLSKAKVLYQLCCNYGIINCWFGDEQLTLYGGIVTMDISREITVYEAVRIHYEVNNMTCECVVKANCQCVKNIADRIYNSEARMNTVQVVVLEPPVKMSKFTEKTLEERYNSGLCAAHYCQEPSEDITLECSQCSGRFHSVCLSSNAMVYNTNCNCGCSNHDSVRLKVNLDLILEVENYLKKIASGEIASWRMKWWQKGDQSKDKLRKHSHISWLEGSTHDQIMNCFLGRDFVKDTVESTVGRVPFILDVILPEAVIYIIQQKQSVSRCFAEKVYDKVKR